MIVDQIFSNSEKIGAKVAISYLGKELSYADLKSYILLKTNSISSSEVCIIRNGNAIDTIVHFLAAACCNKKVIIVPQDWKQDDQWLASVQEELEESSEFKIGILSSGSTGDPKVIWKTNDNWESAFQHQSDLFRVGSLDNVFVLDALSYSANLNTALHALWCGSTLILDALSNATAWSDLIKEQEVTSIFLVPSHWNFLLSKGLENYDVKSCLSAGEKLNAKQAKAILGKFPNATITEYYGAAELGHISYQQGIDIINNPHSVGKAFPGVTIKIIDQQIHINSPYVAPAYKDIGSVGDLGYLENDFLVLLGRAGRMFNKRGLNVFAQEIEQVILLHPQVAKAYLRSVNVLSIPKLELMYELNSSKVEMRESELWELLNEKLSKAKHPHFLKRVEELPTNVAGKIDLGQLSKTLDEEAVIFM